VGPTTADPDHDVHEKIFSELAKPLGHDRRRDGGMLERQWIRHDKRHKKDDLNVKVEIEAQGVRRSKGGTCPRETGRQDLYHEGAILDGKGGGSRGPAGRNQGHFRI
jgi:hypothetical protein